MTLPSLDQQTQSLNKRKKILLARITTSAMDWVYLANEFALIDNEHQVSYCMMQAKKLEALAGDPDLPVQQDNEKASHEE